MVITMNHPVGESRSGKYWNRKNPQIGPIKIKTKKTYPSRKFNLPNARQRLYGTTFAAIYPIMSATSMPAHSNKDRLNFNNLTKILKTVCH